MFISRRRQNTMREAQVAAVFLGPTTIEVRLPPAREEVLPGVLWGMVEAFPTPAYWAFQAFARRMHGATSSHRLGRTLTEEVAACLLGGHGMPAAVGLAAFEHLRDEGVLAGKPTQEELLRHLCDPLSVHGRPVRYRFARQRARYLAEALSVLAHGDAPQHSGRALRDWLLRLSGVGYKTASWIARNWLDADDVAILDVHVLRAGAIAGFLDTRLGVERDYLALERQFIAFAHAICVRPSELDALIWQHMSRMSGGLRRLSYPNEEPANCAPRQRALRARPAPDKRAAHAK
jgi:thermostable 8-oxoguanine DNA glycosylase